MDRQVRALVKRTESDLGHAFGNHDRGQGVAAAERAGADLRHAVGNDDGRQGRAFLETAQSNDLHPLP